MQTNQVPRSFERDGILGALSLLMMAAAVNLHANPITPLPSADLAPTATLITFAGLPVFSQPTSVDGVGFVLANGSGPDVAFDPTPLRQFGPAEGTIIQNIVSGFLGLNIYFPGQVDQLGFDMRTFASETINLTFTSKGNTVEFISLPTQNLTSTPDSPLLFYGFQSTVPFDHVLLDVTGPTSGFFEIDNLAFSSAPDATKTWPLLGIGLALVLLAKRESRSAVGA